MSYTFQGRKVEVDELDIDDDIVSAISAYWEDSEKTLTDDELDAFNLECAQEIHEAGFQQQVCAAEARSDALEDR